MATPELITEAQRPDLERVLSAVARRRTAAGDLPLAELLQVCAELTIEKQQKFKPEDILVRMKPKRQPGKTNNDRLRQALHKLKSDLDEYYKDGGTHERYRFSIEDRTHLVKVAPQRVSPKRLTTDPTGLIDPRVFGEFLRNMCESGPLTRPQRDQQVRLWTESNGVALALESEREFDDLLTKLSDWGNRPRLTFHQMRSLCKHLEIHPIMLDPLLASQVDEECLVLDLHDFVAPPPADDKTYGDKATYAVQPRCHVGSDVHFVYVRLEPGGRSDKHQHPGDEIMVPLEGAIEVWFHENGMRVTVTQGEVIHFHAEQTHSMLNRGDQPAFLFIIRFYQMDIHGGPSPAPSRQQMRREIRRNFAEGSGINPWTKGWILQSLAGRPAPEEPTNQIHDPRGLARWIRLMGPPQSNPEPFLAFASRAQRKSGGSDFNYGTMDAFLNELDTRDLQFPKDLIEECKELFPSGYYDILMLRFLFPSVPGVMVFRPDDPADAVQVPPFAKDMVPVGVTHSIPKRNLVCTDIMISRLTLDKRTGTSFNQHPGFELLIPLEGEAEIQFDPGENGRTYRVSAAEQNVAHYVSGRFHQVRNPGSRPCKMLVIRFYGDRVRKAQRLR